jgi:hypothetical protein
MLLLVAVVGVALVALGALVLLRFPDRPGGRVRLLGLEVSSIGAGLPVLALGVLAVVTAGVQQGDNSQSSTAAGPAPSNTPACITDFFHERPVVPSGRRRALPAEAEDLDVLGPAEQKRNEFGLVLVDKRKVIGAAKMSYDVDATQYRFDGLVDARCRRAAWTAPDVPGANPSTVNNDSTLHLTLGDAEYALELKANGTEVELELHHFER